MDLNGKSSTPFNQTDIYRYHLMREKFSPLKVNKSYDKHENMHKNNGNQNDKMQLFAKFKKIL